MNNASVFAYTLRGRVVWISDKLFHIPVLEDFYRTHQVSFSSLEKLPECTDYVVEYFHKFSPNSLVASPNKNDDAGDIWLAHEKIKSYVLLCEYVNASYHSALPLVFNSEEDKIELLAQGLLTNETNGHEQIKKHQQFIASVINDKKEELKKRYNSFVIEIKNTKTLDEMKQVSYKIVYEAINVV